MMKKAKKEYGYFMRALKMCIGEWGSQNRTAIGANVSDGYISQIVNGKKRASFDVQVAITNSFGYEYVDFLKMGMPPKKPGEDGVLYEDKEILRLLEKSKIILKSKNSFANNSFKQSIDYFINLANFKDSQKIRKKDPPEKKLELLKQRANNFY